MLEAATSFDAAPARRRRVLTLAKPRKPSPTDRLASIRSGIAAAVDAAAASHRRTPRGGDPARHVLAFLTGWLQNGEPEMSAELNKALDLCKGGAL